MEDKDKEISELKRLLKLSLLQLQEYSENDLIMVQNANVSISKLLNKLK